MRQVGPIPLTVILTTVDGSQTRKNLRSERTSLLGQGHMTGRFDHMVGQRILLKLSGTAAPDLGADGASVQLTRLFSTSPTRRRGVGAASDVGAAWYRLDAQTDSRNALGPMGAHPWDVAHSALSASPLSGSILAAEPDLRQGWATSWDRDIADQGVAASETCGPPEGQKGSPFDVGDKAGWHLDDRHSGLRAARTEVGDEARAITIVHLDTGYDPDHAALPKFLDKRRQRNFVEPELGNSAVDRTPNGGILRNRGHGTGTLGILAGADMRGINLNSDYGFPDGFGPLGGTPLAKVVPVRIADSVVHFWTSTVAEGINYARQIGADVVSMSMGGLPSAAWADAVNAAYEAGVVLVCAAGNSFAGLPTSLIVYPARFNRVIAACGVMAEGNPYYGLGGPMEGCAGPASKMATAISAYTPNIPWARLGCSKTVDMDGAGTSSATPQVAAAAALWLAKNGGRFPRRDWQRVEAVRQALFGTAGPRNQGLDQPDPLLGRGMLRAADALTLVPNANHLVQTESDSASFGFLRLLTGAFGVGEIDPRREAMLNLELTQLALNSRGFREAFPEPAVAAQTQPLAALRRGFEAILVEQKASVALSSRLKRVLGRTLIGGGTVDTEPRPSRIPILGGLTPFPRPTEDGFDPPSGRDIERELSIPVPTRRRLRVFATDPGDSSKLATSFVNLATIEVPWENLEPGPVGDYVEVVDVDPATNAVYAPVDLEDRHLLAQDGFAPSEGNPQFHQQMVYAIAMRTIRNFEVALGRRVLWAERRMPRAEGEPFVPAPDGGYVQRLRIYPHALREKNAYYSPDRKALLFGYFDYVPKSPAAPAVPPPKAKPNASEFGRRRVFTCLSHDVVAHETTHALLDGLHRRYQERTNPDVLAFHEAFADIVAIFQHFTFPELLRFEISRLRGSFSQESMLTDLARQFGRALHNSRALRQALAPLGHNGGERRTEDTETGTPLLDYRLTTEPHERGAILVAAVFEAFVSIYTRRTQDLFRIATGGTGVLSPGALHPDLVERLAQEAVDTAQRILTTAIRALDYMPPVDPTFGDFLRAIVTADADFAPDRGMGYRVAFAEAFSRRRIYPEDIRSVSPDGLLWQAPSGEVQSAHLNNFIQSLDLASYQQSDRRMAFENARRNAARLHNWLADNFDGRMAYELGLDFGLAKPDGTPLYPGCRSKDGRPRFEVHSVRPALRATADGEPRVDVVAVITQQRQAFLNKSAKDGPTFTFRGGCTLMLDRSFGSAPIRYAVCRPVWSERRENRMREHLLGGGFAGTQALYGTSESVNEPFRAVHAEIRRD